MKQAILSAAFISLLLFSCKKEDKYMSDAVITGFDSTYCLICCGGLFINLNGEIQHNNDTKLIENSNELGISNSDQFPVYVLVNWEPVPDRCSGKFIKITKLKRK